MCLLAGARVRGGPGCANAGSGSGSRERSTALTPNTRRSVAGLGNLVQGFSAGLLDNFTNNHFP